jgi:hypothetical protein
MIFASLVLNAKKSLTDIIYDVPDRDNMEMYDSMF